MNDVFHALADPTRRILLERLRRDGPLSLTALAEPLQMSRQAVTKHLNVLVSCGLVRREAVGRERIHRLNADPLVALDDWLASYSALWDDRLGRLRAHVDGGDDE